MVQRMIGVFRSKRSSADVAGPIQSSIADGKLVTIDIEETDPISALMQGVEKDIAVGTTESGDIITICLGTEAKRSERQATVVITRP